MSSRRGSQTVGIGQVTQNNEDRTTEVLLCKLPPKERNPGDFTLLCTIDVYESIKKALLKYWVINCFEEALDPVKDPMERSFDDYKWMFDLEIKQLADEYELGIGKKGHILDMIWENCKNIQ
ncbi:hypothetical protein Tco_0755482 [Tanacetum coccineum]